MANTINYGHLETLLGKPTDPVYTFLQRLPYLLEAARAQGQADAHSYRDFHVAGAAYAINPAEKLAREETAGNLKRATKDKVCVEKKLDGRIKKDMVTMVGFVVLGTTDRALIQGVSGLPTPTLHFCNDCRRDLLESRIIGPSTLVINSGLTDDINQTFTVGQVVDMYARAENGDIDPALFKAQPDFTDWEQRLATYDILSGGPEAAAALPLDERQRLAQLALSKHVTS